MSTLSDLRRTGRPLRDAAFRPESMIMGRRGLLLLGGIALLAGLDGALLLLGLGSPIDNARLAAVHGPVMVFGFVGTVVALERAVAARRGWAFLAPGFLGFGGIALISPLPVVAGQLAFVAGSVMLLAIYAQIWRKQESVAIAVQAWGAVLGLLATVLWWRGIGIPQLAPLLILYLVLTIAGERLELSRVSPSVNYRAEQWMFGLSLALGFGSAIALVWPVAGYPVLGCGMLALVAWLLRHDIATRMVRSTGLPRYMALCLLAGYGWLVVVGGIWVLQGPVYSGPAYDALMHAVFLGFVISMIMAHAPTILPAVLRRPLPYLPMMYLPAGLLHLSLLVRVLLGDAYGWPALVQWGGIFNIVAVLLFLVIAVTSVLRGSSTLPVRPRRARSAPSAIAPTSVSLLKGPLA